jgi:hypothetical protein
MIIVLIIGIILLSDEGSLRSIASYPSGLGCHADLRFPPRPLSTVINMSMRREGYGAIPQNVAQDGTEDSNLPGPEEVRIIPDKWKQAPLWIFIFIVLPLAHCCHTVPALIPRSSSVSVTCYSHLATEEHLPSKQ